MMPVKEIMALRPVEPGPPVMVIDETTIRNTADAGPVCGCHEKWEAIQSYVPFIPGGVHPYGRRKIPESDCFDVVWKSVRIGSNDLVFDKPVAIHEQELPENYAPPKPSREEDSMLLRLPRYSQGYFLEKLRECRRDHAEGCDCFAK